MGPGTEHKKHKRRKKKTYQLLCFLCSVSVLAISLVLLLYSAAAYAQNLGHKLPGLIGLDAGRIPEPGLYVVDRAGIYDADKLRDRNGNLLGPLNLFAYTNAFGLSYTFKLSDAIFLTATAGAPIAGLKLDLGNRQQAGIDLLGLADPYIQPIRLGWRKQRFELVTSYGIYLPTDKSALAGGSGISSGQITHQFSVGGTGYLKDRTRFITALASYQLNMRQRSIDITRGDTVQIEGGPGTKLFGSLVETGIAGYALWQVRDDRGAGLPDVFRGARDRVYGLGPEAAVVVKAIHAQVRVRYEWDMGVHARPQGQIFLAGINFLVQKPPQRIP